jgi:hypothetical protein
MKQKSGAACAINHHSSFKQEGPASHMRSRAFLLPAGCSKRQSSKAAASEDARRTLRYVELLSEARTTLADFFSILLKNHRPLRVIAKRAMHIHFGQYFLLLDHENFAADMSRMQMATIGQRIPLSSIEHVAGGNPNVFRFAGLQYHFGFHHKW